MGRKWKKTISTRFIKLFKVFKELNQLFSFATYMLKDTIWRNGLSRTESLGWESIISRLVWTIPYGDLWRFFYFKFNEVFSVVEFKTIWLFTKLVVFFDPIPNVIAIGVMIAIVMKKIQSPARIKGLWRSRFSAIFKRSSLVSALLWRFLLVGSLSVSQIIQLSFSGSP